MSAYFPETSHSVVHALQHEDPFVRARSFEQLALAYYRPVYLHLRVKWQKSAKDAEDVAQEFFLKLTERQTLSAFDPARGRFRTFVRACADNFVLHAREANARQKRGGAFRIVSTETEEAERTLSQLPSDVDVDAVFDREFVRNLMLKSIARLQQRLTDMGKATYFEVFKRYELHEGADEPSYAKVAAELGLRPTDVTNYLHVARRELRGLVMDVLRDLVTTDAEFAEECAELGLT